MGSRGSPAPGSHWAHWSAKGHQTGTEARRIASQYYKPIVNAPSVIGFRHGHRKTLYGPNRNYHTDRTAGSA
eukprot:308807-Pyramimonas_sp.AAC.1